MVLLSNFLLSFSMGYVTDIIGNCEMPEFQILASCHTPLNWYFEGNAIGETLYYEGKSDILIPQKEKNIFIAECMYLGGEKSLILPR